MDLVYVCRNGDNEELRYSLRSIETNFPGQKIWIVGYKPEWYIGPFISVPDISTKFNNIRNALLHVASNPEISDDFVFMNDDFFLIKPIDKFVNYNGGLLADKINRYRQVNPTSSYVILLTKTLEHLKGIGIKNPIDYDIHVPMIFNKQKLLNLAYLQFQPRSLYGNIYKITSETITDVKKYAHTSYMSELSYDGFDYPFISTEDKSFAQVRRTFLKYEFPEPSKYEHP